VSDKPGWFDRQNREAPPFLNPVYEINGQKKRSEDFWDLWQQNHRPLSGLQTDTYTSDGWFTCAEP
jgi:hypothetical protein